MTRKVAFFVKNVVGEITHRHAYSMINMPFKVVIFAILTVHSIKEGFSYHGITSWFSGHILMR